jgi:hypothetical protein
VEVVQPPILRTPGKRADQISSEVALNTYRNTQQIAELLEKLNALTVEVHQHIYHCAE